MGSLLERSMVSGFLRICAAPCWWTLQRESPAGLRNRDPCVRDAQEVSAAEPDLCCANCLHPITSRASGVEISGKHSHTCFNPDGVVFQIGCFGGAPGCMVRGRPTVDFSWFPGYQWNFAHCTNCFTQLGWYFQQAVARPFFGLERNKLVQCRAEGGGE